MDKRTKYIGGGALILGIFFVGFIFGQFEKIKSSIAVYAESKNSERENKQLKQWNFVNPLLDCGEFENVSNPVVNEMKEEVGKLIDKQKTQGVDAVAVYFRDLNNGPWFIINEKEKFSPASLLKVPVMISILKKAEQDPSILNKSIFIKDLINNYFQYFKPENYIVASSTYTVNQLLSYMILYSDNGAMAALEQLFGDEYIYEIYNDLGINVPEEGNQYLISIRDYSLSLRVLYNASYLNRDYSEQALKLLSQTKFNKGLRSGTPVSLPIAHKFGELTSSDNVNQLHDCGIVYYPNNPYLLCIMTRGNGFNKLAETIAQISKIVYTQVSQEK